MKKSLLLITASLVVCFSVAAYATPIAITQGSFDLKNMITTLSFQGTPGIISSDFSFSGIMGEQIPGGPGLDPFIEFDSPGSYSLITSESILVANLNDNELKSLVSFAEDIQNPQHPGAESSTSFRRNLSVSNLKAISVDLDYTSVIALTTDPFEISSGLIFTSLGLSQGSTGLTGVSTSHYEDAYYGEDVISSKDGTMKLSYTFSSPFSGLLNLTGNLTMFSKAGTYHAVPEPRSIGFILPGLAGLIGVGLLRRRTA